MYQWWICAELKNGTGSFTRVSRAREREREHQEAPRDSLQLTKKLMVTEMLLPDLCNLIMSSSGWGMVTAPGLLRHPGGRGWQTSCECHAYVPKSDGCWFCSSVHHPSCVERVCAHVSYCRGSIPRVPWAAGYNPKKLGTTQLPLAGEWLGSHSLRARYGPTTPD
jgi:hypothetical protein